MTSCPGVHLVTHGHTNCYVVEGEDGVTLVDAAFPKTWAAVRQCLADVGRSACEVRGLVITHGHFDHVGFARAGCSAATGCPSGRGAADAHLLRHPYRYRPARPRLTYPPTHPRSLPVLAVDGPGGRAARARAWRPTTWSAAGSSSTCPAAPSSCRRPGTPTASTWCTCPTTAPSSPGTRS